MRFIKSPNFNVCFNRKIECIVLHATGSNNINSTIYWFENPESKVSAHYIIDKNGDVVQMVQDKDIAWHCGDSRWRGKRYVNRYSVGVELVNLNDGKDNYPCLQITETLSLCKRLCRLYGLDDTGITTHKAVSPDRKHDPAGWDEEGFKKNLQALLQETKET